MARLTAAIREAIINNAVNTKDFSVRDKAIVQKRANFAERLRLFVLDQYGLTDARLSKIKSQIDDFRNEVTHNGASYVLFGFDAQKNRFDVNLAGQRRTIYLDGRSHDDSAKQLFSDSEAAYSREKYTPHTWEDIFIVKDPAWREELDAIDMEARSLREEYFTLQSTMKEALSNFTTVENLLKAWPDVKELIPETLPIAKKPGTGVSLSTSDLNALCGIPTGK